MKSKVIFSRYNLLWVILSLYTVPIVALIAYNVIFENASHDWNALSLGIFLASFGTLIFFGIMTRLASQTVSHTTNPSNSEQHENFAEALPEGPIIDPEEYKITKLSLEEAQQAQIRLLQEIDVLTEELRQTTASKLQELQLLETTKGELGQLRLSSSQHLEQQQRHIRELQGAVAEQKSLVEKKQQQITLLESRVNDLTHEIKTLLHFAESRTQSLLSSIEKDPPPLLQKSEPEPLSRHEEHNPVPNLEAQEQLKRCIDIAQKIMGSQRFGSQLYSFLESPADSYSLDLRRLCDRLRSETNKTILLYSPKENQLLFASNQIKELTGWSPEKFAQNFGEILQDKSPWKYGIEGLNTHSETQAHLSVATRAGQPVSLQAHLGMIPSGIFRNYILAVIEPA